ncbi:MAG TPA: hypothetical protein VGC89_06570 [Pyrinomonadaceae bacterium]|jgi:hypothetical protein
MELSSLLFSLGLLSAGIWLILTINGDFKEKQRQGQRLAAAPAKQQQLARPPAAATRRAMTNARRLSTAPTVDSPRSAAPPTAEQAEATDQFQHLNAALVLETFERFRSEL